MKTKFICSIGLLLAAPILILLSCKKQITAESLNGIYIVPLTNNSASENKTLLYSTTPVKFALGTAISSPATTDLEVTIAVDNSMINAYNAAQNTKYATMPDGSYALEATELTILKDGIASNETKLVIKSDLLTPDVSYLLPIKVVSVSNSSITLNSAIGTKYFIIRTPTPVIGNLSDGKISSMSKGFNPQRGNDGNPDGDWSKGSVCETGAGNEEFWQVDLGAISPRIDDVKIWNRTDCCDDRTAKFYVFISNEPFNGTTVAAALAQPGVYKYYNDGKAGAPTTITPGVSGRYIRLQNTTTASLTLAELRATGIKP